MGPEAPFAFALSADTTVAFLSLPLRLDLRFEAAAEEAQVWPKNARVSVYIS